MNNAHHKDKVFDPGCMDLTHITIYHTIQMSRLTPLSHLPKSSLWCCPGGYYPLLIKNERFICIRFYTTKNMKKTKTIKENRTTLSIRLVRGRSGHDSLYISIPKNVGLKKGDFVKLQKVVLE